MRAGLRTRPRVGVEQRAAGVWVGAGILDRAGDASGNAALCCGWCRCSGWVGWLWWEWGALRGCCCMQHSLVSPHDLRRMNAAFFTLNGVISVVFFGFFAADVLLRR